jgi:O-antigen ligase
MTTLTGRTALWRVMGASIREAPLIGHGYFVTSPSGRVDVWRDPANLTAHNALLQVLVSTGLVGLGLFVWGLGRPIVAGVRALGRGGLDRRFGVLVTPVAAWYVVWSQVNDSYAGPLQPETVAFFVLLGVVAGLGRARP